MTIAETAPIEPQTESRQRSYGCGGAFASIFSSISHYSFFLNGSNVTEMSLFVYIDEGCEHAIANEYGDSFPLGYLLFMS